MRRIRAAALQKGCTVRETILLFHWPVKVCETLQGSAYSGRFHVQMILPDVGANPRELISRLASCREQ